MVISKKLDGAAGIRRTKEKIARCTSSLKKIYAGKELITKRNRIHYLIGTPDYRIRNVSKG